MIDAAYPKARLRSRLVALGLALQFQRQLRAYCSCRPSPPGPAAMSRLPAPGLIVNPPPPNMVAPPAKSLPNRRGKRMRIIIVKTVFHGELDITGSTAPAVDYSAVYAHAPTQ